MFHIGLKIKHARTSKKRRNPKTSNYHRKVSEILTRSNNFMVITDESYLQPNWEESVDKFDDMGLKEEVLRGIYGYGFNKPSPIQQKGILPVIQGHDTIA